MDTPRLVSPIRHDRYARVLAGFFAQISGVLLLCVGVGAHPALAAYPEAPLKIYVGTIPGTAVDVMARMLAQKMSDSMGQPVIVQNAPGAGGMIAATQVARASPDGYSLLIAYNTHPISPFLFTKLEWDPVKDFTAVSLTGTQPLMMVTRSDLPVKSVRDVIDLAKRNPGKLNVGTAGIGSPAHLSGALFASMAGVDLLFVPYKGAPAALTDLMGGQLDFYFATIPTALPHVRTGKLRALAMTSAKRSSVLPEVPTIGEAGVPGYDFSAWFGIMAPARTPPERVARLNMEIARAMQAPDVREKLAAQGVEPTVSTSVDFAMQVEDEYRRGAALAKSANIKPE